MEDLARGIAIKRSGSHPACQSAEASPNSRNSPFQTTLLICWT